MIEKTENSRAKFCTTKRRTTTKLMMIITHLLDTVWAIGVSVAAAMAFSASFHSRKA